MDWPGQDMINGVPVVLDAGRPGRARYHRQHQAMYFQDANGRLVVGNPAGFGDGIQRSASANGVRPTQIVINNSQWEDHSPVRGQGQRRISHGHDHHHRDEDDWDVCAHSPPRHGRPRSRVRARTHESRTPSPFYDPEYERKMKKLEELERKEEEEEQQKKFKEQLLLAEAKKAAKKKEEEEMKKLAVEEYNVKRLEKEVQEKQEKEKADKEFEKRVKTTFGAAGYSEESIKKILEGKKGEKGHKGPKKIMDLTRPTYIKVHRKYLSPDTLDVYDLPWEWDDVSYLSSSLNMSPNHPPLLSINLPEAPGTQDPGEKPPSLTFPSSAIQTTSSSNAGSPNTTRKSSSNTRAKSARVSSSQTPPSS